MAMIPLPGGHDSAGAYLKIPDFESLLALFAAQVFQAVPTASDINVFERSVNEEFLCTFFSLFLIFFFLPLPYTLFGVFFVCQTLPGISNEEAKNCRRKRARGGGWGEQCREKKTGEETQGVFSTLTVR